MLPFTYEFSCCPRGYQSANFISEQERIKKIVGKLIIRDFILPLDPRSNSIFGPENSESSKLIKMSTTYPRTTAKEHQRGQYRTKQNRTEQNKTEQNKIQRIQNQQ